MAVLLSSQWPPDPGGAIVTTNVPAAAVTGSGGAEATAGAATTTRKSPTAWVTGSGGAATADAARVTRNNPAD
jgi:hypothetical protein